MSNSTTDPRKSVRSQLSEIVGVSAGTYTKVKQLLDRPVPDVKTVQALVDLHACPRR
jgi:hypothetical protein